jgi:hypothetical protein
MASQTAGESGLEQEPCVRRAVEGNCAIGKILDYAGSYNIMYGRHLQGGAMKSQGDASHLDANQRKFEEPPENVISFPQVFRLYDIIRQAFVHKSSVPGNPNYGRKDLVRWEPGYSWLMGK